MATKYGHIYTKNSTGTIDKFVPVLDSSQINHGNDNVENVLNDTVKSVSVEVIDGEPVTIEETIQENINNIELGIYTKNLSLCTSSNIGLYSIITNETYNIGQFTIPSGKTGIGIFFEGIINNYYVSYSVMPNGSYSYNYGDMSGTISNSPYADDSNYPGEGYISISELPSTGQTKTFYATAIFTDNVEEYTGTDIQFIITNIDGTNYSLSFIWEKVETVTSTTKVLQTTATKNDDTEVVTTSPISGILQDMSASSEQKLDNAKIYDINAHIEIWTAST